MLFLFSDTYLYTTMYPIEYAAEMLYGDYAVVSSVYPNGATPEYEVTQKKKEKYSDAEIFIYSVKADEASLAKDLVNINGNLKLIDATRGIPKTKKLQSTWLVYG